MMVPRSYPFLHSSPPSPRKSPDKMGAASPRRASPTPNRARIEAMEKDISAPEKRGLVPTSESPAKQPTTPTHSQPVVIPPRMPANAAPSTQSVRARGHNGGRPARLARTHKSDSVPPAVAALLAVTEIPKMPPRRRKGSSMDKRRISMDELIQEWKQDDTDFSSSVAGSPMDILLGRLDESEDEYGSLRSVEQEKYSMTSRSISSESLSTIPPSLDHDAPSLSSNWDNLSTPDSLSRKSLPERREKKMVSSPPKEDCILDHPLLHFRPDESDEIASTDVSDIDRSSRPSNERFRSFKSNLTASLHALKSAAKSFSNFTAPSVPPDDLLTRSLLSPKFTSEMRPKQLEGVPSAALRRYLNPQPTPTSPTELSMQLHDSLSLDVGTGEHAPMIQMQTYERRGRSSNRKRKSSDPYSEAGRALATSPTVRQREPRENSDFLRVIVLEMNMRRVGKLDARAVGKARVWLPPRKVGVAGNKAPSMQSSRGVPNRWMGSAAADGPE